MKRVAFGEPNFRISSGAAYLVFFSAAARSALHDIGKLEVTVNGPKPRAGSVMGGNAVVGGNTVRGGGGAPPLPAAPEPPGSPLQVFVGIKPVKIPALL